MISSSRRGIGVRLLTGAVWIWCAAVVAAQEGQSHRRIDSPQLQGMDFVKQMELLQRLQSLAGRLQENSGDDGTPPTAPQLPENVSPEDLEKFKNLMTRLGITPPAGSKGTGTDSFPGGGKGESPPPDDPQEAERQRLLEELMRRLSGEQPEIRPPAEEPRTPTPDRPHGGSGETADPRNPSGRAPDNGAFPENPSGSSPRSGVTMRSRRDGAGNSPRDSGGDRSPMPGNFDPAPDAADPSRFFGERPNRNPLDSTASPDSRSPALSNRFQGRPPRNDGAGAGRNGNQAGGDGTTSLPDGTMDAIEHRLSPFGVGDRDRPGRVPSSLINPEDLPASDSSPPSSLFNPQTGREIAEHMRSGSNGSRPNEGLTASPSIPSGGLSPELLKQIPDWLEALRRLEGEPGPSPSSAGPPRGRSGFGESSAEQGDERTDPQISSLAKALNESQSLQELGQNLRSTLTEVSKRARQETRQETQEEADGSFWEGLTGFRSVAEKSVASLRETLTKSPDGAGDNGNDRSAGNSPRETKGTSLRSGGAPSPTRDAIRDALSPLRDVAKNANQWVMSPPTPPAESDRTGSSPTLPTVSPPVISWPLVLFSLMTAGILLWLWNRRGRRLQQIEEERALVQMALELRGREDVIRVYHALAARSPAVRAKWWPHQKATEAMAAASPDHEEPLGTLTRIYERARYLPEQEILSATDLESARAAIERCVTA